MLKNVLCHKIIFTLIILSLILGATACSDQAKAQCINYEEISHWEANISIPYIPSDVRVCGNYAYVVTNYGLHIVDISDPANPQMMGEVYMSGFSIRVAVSGNYAYVGGVILVDGEFVGLQIVDISDPMAPCVVGSMAGYVEWSAIALSGNYVFLAREEFCAIDISDPENPLVVGCLSDPPSQNCRSVAIQNELAFVSSGHDGLRVIDISDPTNLEIIGSVDIPGFSKDVEVSGSLAFVISSSSGLQIIDISDPEAPQIIGNAITGDYYAGVEISGNRAYMLGYHPDMWGSNLYSVDVSDPANPLIEGSVGVIPHSLGMAISNDHVFVGTDNSNDYNYNNPLLQIFKVSEQVSPQAVGAVNVPGWTNAISLAKNYAYVAAGESGLQVVAISDPFSPQIVGSLAASSDARDVAISDNLACVADGNLGLQVIDIYDPANPAAKGSVGIPGGASSVVIGDGFAYVGDDERALHVVDFSDVEHPHIVESIDIGDYIERITISGNLAFLGCWGGIKVVDILDPGNCEIIGSLEVLDSDGWPASMVGVAVVGDLAYVAAGSHGLLVVDISDPTNPVIVASVSTPDFARNVAVSGYWAYVNTSNIGVSVFDISDPSFPRLAGIISTPTSCQDVKIMDGYVYILDNLPGLMVFPFQCSDCNENGIPDETEIALDPSLDLNLDGILDSCQEGQNPTAVPSNNLNVAHFGVLNAYPNPFNPQTTIVFELPRAESVSLRVFDIAGHLVRVLVDDDQYGRGRHEAVWNGRDDGGLQASSGTYFYRLDAGEYNETKRMVLLK